MFLNFDEFPKEVTLWPFYLDVIVNNFSSLIRWLCFLKLSKLASLNASFNRNGKSNIAFIINLFVLLMYFC